MADDRHYVPGDFYRIDDRSGFKIRAKASKKEWTNLIVARGRWEPRQPQDFVKGVIDDQTVPDARPRQTDLYIGPGSAKFQVYGDNPLGRTFLVQNGGGYDPGINAESSYTNPKGAAQITVFNGTIATVIASGYPNNVT